MTTLRRSVCACAALILFISSANSLAVEPARVVAFTGQQAPDAPAGALYNGINGVLIDDRGRATIYGDLMGTGVIIPDNAQAVWAEIGSAPLHVLARNGFPAPGTASGVNFFGVFPNLGPSNQIVIFGDLTGPGIDNSNLQGLWSTAPGALSLIARRSFQADDTPAGTLWSQFGVPAINRSGRIAFYGTLSGVGIDLNNDRGVWAQDSSGSLKLLARDGSHAPGTTDPGDHFTDLHNTVMNDAGKCAFYGRVSGPGVTATNRFGVWAGDSSGLVIVARAGDQAPGTEPGITFANFGDPDIDAAGDVCFSATLTGAGVDPTNDTGIWETLNGSLTLVARKGDAAPGLSVTALFSSFVGQPIVSAGGRVAFSATLAGASITTNNDEGLWAGSPGALVVVFREGSQAPGTPVNTLFGSPSTFAMNPAGDVVFFASLAGLGVTAGVDDQSIWLRHSDGTFELTARTGEVVTLAQGDA
ncbi:MAG TPA: choice-of-anchor tandem repeat NxxGxxAF-containing protein, partial [Phycisphaerae bacterium]|nr:choice-of-anchor tandem repeat NxxGxxAF-containing protein [Phycisphaerae bacterium]